MDVVSVVERVQEIEVTKLLNQKLMGYMLIFWLPVTLLPEVELEEQNLIFHEQLHEYLLDHDISISNITIALVSTTKKRIRQHDFQCRHIVL